MVLAQDLRNAVLQAAFQGKLTTQNISSFVKYGIGQNGTFSQDGLFDIPQNWQWKKFSDLCINISTGPFGTMLHKTDYESSGIPLVNPVHMINGNIVPSDNAKVSKEKYKELRRYVLHDGDIVIARRGELGRVAVVTSNEDGWLCGTGSFFITPKDSVDARYLILFFSVPYVRFALLGDSVGTTMNNLNQSLLKKLPIPFPPIEEQRRIVERVNAIMAQIDEYEKIEQELAKLKADFPSDMKAAILQAAMQGKLTEQLDTDSSVDELLSKICKEKQELIEKGALRNKKEPSLVTDDEAPFDIPNNWRFVRLSTIGHIYGGGTPKTSQQDFWGGSISWITPADMNNCGRYIGIGRKSITQKGLDCSSAQLFPKGSVIISSRAPIGYIAIAENSACTSQGCKTFSAYSQKLISPEYIYYVLLGSVNDMISRASGTTFKEISASGVGDTIIPIPPH